MGGTGGEGKALERLSVCCSKLSGGPPRLETAQQGSWAERQASLRGCFPRAGPAARPGCPRTGHVRTGPPARRRHRPAGVSSPGSQDGAGAPAPSRSAGRLPLPCRVSAPLKKKTVTANSKHFLAVNREVLLQRAAMHLKPLLTETLGALSVRGNSSGHLLRPPWHERGFGHLPVPGASGHTCPVWCQGHSCALYM